MRTLVLTLSVALLSLPTFAQVCGDTDGDGAASIIDALATARAGLGMGSVVGEAFHRADVNSDGVLNVLDALSIAQFSAGLPATMQCTFPPPSVNVWSDQTPVGGAQDLGQRCEHASAIDAPRNRAIFYSGFGPGGAASDVWALDFATRSWSPLVPTGTRPLGGLNLKMVGDAARDRVLLFAGSELWALDFSISSSGTWQILGSLPIWGTPGDTADFDAAGNRAILVQGGYVGTPQILEVDFTAGPVGVARLYPAPGFLGQLGDIQGGIDSARNRYVVVDAAAGLVAAVDLATVGVGLTPVITQLTPAGVAGPSRNLSMSDFDDAGDQLLVFGGTSLAEFGITAIQFAGSPDGEWVTLGATSPGPIACSHPAIVYDGSDELFIHGGANLAGPVGVVYDRTWSFELR